MDEHRAHVRLQVDARLVEREGADARGRGGPDARQAHELLVGAGEGAAVLVHDLLRRTMQGKGAAVVAHALPLVQDVGVRRGGEGLHRGEAQQPGGPARLHAHHLRLLEHDLGEPYLVRVARVAPGKVAPVLGTQAADLRAEGVDVKRELGRHGRLLAAGTPARPLGGIARGDRHGAYSHETCGQPRRRASRRSVGPAFTAAQVCAASSRGASV